MKIVFLYVLLFTVVVRIAQNNQIVMEKTIKTQSSEESQIIEVVHLLIDLMIEKDIQRINEIVDENFTLTHITGYVQSKSDWFDEIESESMRYYSAKEVSIKVRIDENIVECIVQDLLDARIWGSRNTWRLHKPFSSKNVMVNGLY